MTSEFNYNGDNCDDLEYVTATDDEVRAIERERKIDEMRRQSHSFYRTPRAQMEQENLELFLEVKPTDNAALALGRSNVYKGVRYDLAKIARAALGHGKIVIQAVESIGGLKFCVVVYRLDGMDHPSMYTLKADRDKADRS